MADVVVSFLVQNLLDRISASASRSIGTLQNTRKEVEKLSATLSAIQAVVEDAEEMQIRESTVRVWLERLRDVTYDADDILDDFNAKEDEAQVCLRIFNPHNIISRFKMADRIKDIRGRLDEIAKDRDAFRLEGRSGNRYVGLQRPTQISSSLMEGTDVFGRDDEKKRMVDFLVSEDECNSRAGVSVVCVVGMGGIGKTALAQLAYNDERVVEHFELRMWVCVSEDFDVRRLTRAIIESATRQSPEAGELDPLQVCLKEMLCGKRFLLVWMMFGMRIVAIGMFCVHLFVWGHREVKWLSLLEVKKFLQSLVRSLLTIWSVCRVRIVGLCLSSVHLWRGFQM